MKKGLFLVMVLALAVSGCASGMQLGLNALNAGGAVLKSRQTYEQKQLLRQAAGLEPRPVEDPQTSGSLQVLAEKPRVLAVAKKSLNNLGCNCRQLDESTLQAETKTGDKIVITASGAWKATWLKFTGKQSLVMAAKEEFKKLAALPES